MANKLKRITPKEEMLLEYIRKTGIENINQQLRELWSNAPAEDYVKYLELMRVFFNIAQPVTEDVLSDKEIKQINEKLKNGYSILVYGATGLGKTTVVRNMIDKCDIGRMLCIEKHGELVKREDKQETNSVAGKELVYETGDYLTLKHLETIMREQPIVIIGETNGENIVNVSTMLNMDRQFITTIHAINKEQLMDRLVSLNISAEILEKKKILLINVNKNRSDSTIQFEEF